MIHELRIYQAAPGRLNDLHKRFREIAIPIFSRIGIRPVAFWTTLIGSSGYALYYLLEWESMDERQRLWAQFLEDQEWIARKAATETNGVVVAHFENQLLLPTDYSPLRTVKQPGSS